MNSEARFVHSVTSTIHRNSAPRSEQASPNFLRFLALTSGLDTSPLLLRVVTSLAIDTNALASSGVSTETLMPVKLLNMRLLLFVGLLFGVIGRIRLLVIILTLLLLGLVDPWSEHIWRDSFTTAAKHDRNWERRMQCTHLLVADSKGQGM